MSLLVDTHCHLLAGLDDGPQTIDEALEMCRLAWEDGIGRVAATAHLGDQWPDVTVAGIREATRRLAAELQQHGPPLAVCPAAEIMIRPDLPELWEQGQLLGVGGRSDYLLTELPGGTFWDFTPLVRNLVTRGARPILAHPERHPELLHERGTIESLVSAGCLIQVASDSIAEPLSVTDQRAIRRWVCDGLVHLVGSDGHSPFRRTPRMAAACRQVAAWAGQEMADRLCRLNGALVLDGRPLPDLPRRPPRRRWFSRLWPGRSAAVASRSTDP